MFSSRYSSTKPIAVLLTGVVMILSTALVAEAGIKRTASGKPDLSGTYDAATLTPLERPEEFGDNLYLTQEKAAEIVKRQQDRVAERAQISDPNREAPPDGGDGSPGAAGNVGGYNNFWLDVGTDTFSVDGKFRTSIIVEPKNGRMPPMTDVGTARLAKLFAGFRRENTGTAWWLDEEGPGPYDNMEQRHTAERCLLGFTGAAPTVPSAYNNFKRIVQTEDHVMILIEMVHDARIVRMNSEHIPAGEKKWLGDSIGWWEDDTLVIDTTNFHPLAGRRGSSDTNHVVERLTMQDDGNVLYRFTVEDPAIWTQPWTGEYIWKADEGKVYEYACHEGNYSFGNIMRGARMLERDSMFAPKNASD
ncbi:MAG: hypothetical protein O7E57_00525 [Gammaproteobacteria bacterium]|nr:hypothetical protein [Gammaproteobacteria bacterium]